MRENLHSKVNIKNGEFEVAVFQKEQAEAELGKPYSNLQEEKREITLDQDAKDKRELAHENLKEMLKHHEDAVKNLKAEIAALEKDMKEDESDITVESEAATEKQKEARKKFMEMIQKKKGGDKKEDDEEDKDDDKKSKKKEASKAAYEKIDEKELKRDTKKEKVEHEKDAISDDKSKIKKLEKGKPSAKKTREKKDLKKDIQYDKDSKEKMEADYGMGDDKKVKPKKSYAEMLMDIAAERYGGKKRSELKDSDFLDPKRRSFPVMSAQDVKDAVSSWGRYKGSMTFDEFKAKLIKRAKKIGAESALPKTFTEDK
tara:strand:+ start:261 stop:1205 length:945 start_codon:yes stop_codon:yes gene_type:complete